jgi:hypothetical protein
MYRGFNVEYNKHNETYFSIGEKMFEEKRKIISKEIEPFLNQDKSLSASRLQENWFPSIKSDIFLSHSHKDEKMAITLAGYLKKELQLDVFIDSCLWGSCFELLKIVDDKYCVTKEGFYDYEKRNYSTNHIYMLLSSSLMKMIDNCECLFFLKTPNSIKISDSINSKTNSPWIYHEINSFNLIRKKTPIRIAQLLEKGGSLNKNLQVEYNFDNQNLTSLTEIDIEFWSLFKMMKQSTEKAHPLDILYRLPLVEKNKNNLIYG